MVAWFKMHIKPHTAFILVSAKHSPGTMDCLPAGVSALADPDLDLLALKGTWGNVHHWALCSQGVGREA